MFNSITSHAKAFWHTINYRLVVVDVDKDNKPIKTIEKKRSKVFLWLLAIVLIFSCSFLFITMPTKIRIDQIGVIFGQMFTPSKWSLKTWDGYWAYLFNKAIPSIWDTVEMVFIATVLGTIIAFPLFLIASRNVVVHPYIYQPVRFLVDFIRTIPTYILAILCTVFFGLGETAGIWAMAIFTLGIMFKFMYEYIDTCDMNPFEASISTGATRMKAFNVALMPEVKPMFFSNFIYTFELNIRASVILGFVGAGGIGQMLSNAMEAQTYDKVGAILIPLFILVVCLQLISSYVRRKSL